MSGVSTGTLSGARLVYYLISRLGKISPGSCRQNHFLQPGSSPIRISDAVFLMKSGPETSCYYKFSFQGLVMNHIVATVCEEDGSSGTDGNVTLSFRTSLDETSGGGYDNCS